MLRETDNLTGGNAKREFKIPAFRDQGRMKVSFRKQWHQKQREKFLFKEAMTRFSLEGQEETVPMYIQIRSKPNEDAVAYKKEEKEHRRKWLETYRQRAEETRRWVEEGVWYGASGIDRNDPLATPPMWRRKKKGCSVVKHGAKTAARNES